MPDVEGVTITAGCNNPGPVDPSDGLIIIRIADKVEQTLTVTATKQGYDPVVKKFRLNELTIEKE